MPTRFIVPQFIEEESRILGKITVRQFIILVVAGVAGIIAFRLFGPLSVGFLVTILFVIAPALVVALVKINGQNFHIFALNFLSSFKKPGLRIWNKEVSLEDLKFEMQRERLLLKKKKKEEIVKEKPTSSRLAELSLIVDTGGMYKGE